MGTKKRKENTNALSQIGYHTLVKATSLWTRLDDKDLMRLGRAQIVHFRNYLISKKNSDVIEGLKINGKNYFGTDKKVTL